ncbi:F-box protein PP2-B1-like [Triticum urartu]|nr:F-box protein PP2-B1-like [Triticum urartu]
MEVERVKKLAREEEKAQSRIIQGIPEECLAKAIGLTSPADACRAAAVSTAFRSAADLDAVWTRFLPPDCDAVLERAVHLVDAPSKKELFIDLSNEHVVLDDGKMSFGLERSNGAKCYMLSASELVIEWMHENLYWTRRTDPDSRFSKVAELLSVCWLHIYGTINSRELTPATHYAAYLVFKLTHDASGLSSPRQTSFVKVGGGPCLQSCRPSSTSGGASSSLLVGSTHTVSLHPCNRASCTRNGAAAAEPHEHEQGGGVGGVVRYPRHRVDGWLELEMGDFHTDTDICGGDDVMMEVHEWEELKWKKGLIIEGIEIRPRN